MQAKRRKGINIYKKLDINTYSSMKLSLQLPCNFTSWMKTAHRGREFHEPTASDPMDVFSPNGQFREWLDVY